MSTEYRRGIPSTAHVEAATRLGLLWGDNYSLDRRWHFEIRDGVFHSDFESPDVALGELRSGPGFWMPPDWVDLRPIRPDGTPVDWEVLDQEVARVGRRGQPATVTPTASAAPTTQPQGFRADLWQALSSHLTPGNGCRLSDTVRLDWRGFRVQNPFFTAEIGWPAGFNSADILARWTVYRELKPLYDIVDGAQGEAAMPRDVINQWWLPARNADRARQPIERCTLIRSDTSPRYPQGRGPTCSWYADGADVLDIGLHNFAAVLDAVAERRVAERMRGQASVTAAQPEQHRHNWIYDGLGGGHSGQYNHNCACGERDWFAEPMSAPSPREAVVRPAAQPEPRRFADVRPDRHGWRWWRDLTTGDCFTIREGVYVRRFDVIDSWLVLDLSAWLNRTVIPTDEQGNPVSWESIGPTDPTEMRYRQALAQTMTVQASPGRVYDVEWAPTNATGTLRDVHTARIRQLDRFVSEAIQAGNIGSFTPPRPGQFSNNPATPPLTPEGLLSAMQNYTVHATIGTGAASAKNPPVTTLPPLLPRFTPDELNDVDHSKTTKLDEVTLRRGKLPTVEQIAKYREVRTRRTGGTVADALKESRIDCEVAQYVLERWAGGLGDAESLNLIRAAVAPPEWDYTYQPCATPPSLRPKWVDSRISAELSRATLDTSEKPSPTVQRERQEAEERRQRLAELRQRLAAERAAQPQEMAKESEVSRFDLIEPDPQADPTASIRAWEARQAAAKVRPAAAPARPAAAPRRPAIEVVDAEVDGLSRSEAFTALFGRALNGGC